MKHILTLLLLIVAVSVHAQPPNLQIQQADRYFENNQFTEAIKYYQQALAQDEDNTKAKYGLAESYRETLDYESAEYYYGQVARLGSEVYPLAGYYFGLMKKLNGDYNEAIIELDKAVRFLKQNGFSEDDRYRKFYIQAKIEKEGCQFALNELSKPKSNRKFHLLGEPVNTESNEYAAYTYRHDSSLVISSGRAGGTGMLIDNKFGESLADIFRFSEIREDEWKEARDSDRFSRTVNSKWGDGAGAFNKGRTKYYFSQCGNEETGDNEEVQECHIFVSELVDGEWQEPKKLNRNINKKGFDSKHPSLSPSGDTLFFASNLPGGMGGLDIWYSVSLAGDNWGAAQNMGDQVNTAFREISPFYDANEKALFFASTGHRGFGGLDIFMARGKNFLNPEIFNIGAPYNSNQDECFFMLGEKHGYVTSNRDGGVGGFDIYTFRIENDDEIISEIQVDEAIAGRNSVFSDDYDFDTQNETKVNEIISQLLAAKIADVDAVLSSEDQKFYNSLSKDDKARVDRIVDARFRNMAQSELRALRIEDEFYYQNLGEEKRKAIDQMILSRIEQNDLALSIQYEEPIIEFYNSLGKEEKEKVDQFIAFKLAEAEKILLSQETYNSLTDEDKRQVDNITLKYFEEKKNLDALPLSPSSLMFIRNLEGVTKQNIYAAVKEQISTLATSDQFKLTEDDKIFYQNLNSQDLDKLEGIATAFIAADLDQFQDYITPSERSFYQLLNKVQRKSADRVLAKLINNIIKSDLYFAEANLKRSQIALLSEKQKSVSSISELMASITEPSLKGVQQLAEENQKRLERFLVSTAEDYVNFNISGYFPEGADKIAEQYAIIAEEKAAKAEEEMSSRTTKPTPSMAVTPAPSEETTSDPNPKSEDSYYSRLDKQQQQAVDDMVLAQIEQSQFTDDVQYNEETMDFYNSLSTEDQEQVNKFIAARLEESKNVKLTPATYSSLDEEDKTEVDKITRRYFEEKENLDELELDEQSESFVASLDEDKKEKVYTSVKEQIINLANTEEYRLTDTDRALYSTLSRDDISKLEGIATAFIAADLDKFQDFISPSEKALYQTMSQQNKESADRILANLINSLLKSDLYFAEANLDKQQISMLAEKRKSLSSISELMSTITEPELSDLQNLEDENKRRLERFLASTADNYISDEIEGYFPEGADLAAEQYAVTAQKGEDINMNTRPEIKELNPADALYYDESDPAVKLAIDRTIGAKYLNEKGSADAIKQQASDHFRDLPPREKDFVKMLAEKMKGRDVNPSVFIPALSFYNSIAPNAKAKYNDMVLSRALEIKGDRFVAPAEDRQLIAGLPAEEQAIITKIQAHRFANQRLIPDKQIVEANDIPDRQVVENLMSYNTSDYGYINISGQLTDEETGKPLANYALSLQKPNGNAEYETYTDSQGRFTFDNVPSANYEIVAVNSDESAFTSSYFIRSLDVTGTRETAYSKRVETAVYFESARIELRPEGMVALDEIIEAYQASDEPFVIELNGNTDNVGDEQNNLGLSKARSTSVYQYLVAKGIPANKILINFFGQDNPVSANNNPFGRQFNRRVDVILKADEKIEYSPADIYLIRPKGTLYSIAKNFEVTIPQLREWNGLAPDDVILAFRPLRVHNPKNLRPNLDMLVELENTFDVGYKSYVVKEGDTLRSLSERFNVPEELIYEMNNLSSRRLQPGQSLRIYINY